MPIQKHERVRVRPMQRYSGIWGIIIEPPNSHGICIVELDNGITEQFHMSDIAGSNILKCLKREEEDEQ